MGAFYSHVCDSENSASVNDKVATGKRISKGLADYHLHHKGGAEDIPSMVDLNAEVKEEVTDSTGTFSLPAAAASILSMVPTFEVASSEPDRLEGFF